MDGPRYWAIWGKSPRDSKADWDHYLPLIYHLINVAQVAGALWDDVVVPAVKERACTSLAASGPEAVGRWFAFLAGLHDLGKASPAFAGRREAPRRALLREGFTFPRIDMCHIPHGWITASTVRGILCGLGFSPRQARLGAAVVGAHHGVFPLHANVREASISAVIGGPEWASARVVLSEQLRDAIGLKPVDVPDPKLDAVPWLVVLLAGLTSVADWIGSDEVFFPHCNPGADLAEYSRQASAKARLALRSLAWTADTEPGPLLNFEELFPGYRPYDVQRLAIEISRKFQPPGLVLIESPTGGGKTEAALYLASSWEQVGGLRGIYFGLPTQATSNQMFSRVSEFLSRRYPRRPVGIQLLHGHASLSAEFRAIRQRRRFLLQPAGISGAGSFDGADPSLVAAEWFTYRKRGLLAPYGVGTVDQALLATLQTRHYFVRLAGLAGKTVIIDEVHAYDTYMATILDRLLCWLGCLGSSVILLSATLPRNRRKDLIAAYATGLSLNQAGDPARLGVRHGRERLSSAPYPRVTWWSTDETGVRSVEAHQRQVALKWVGVGSTGYDQHRRLGADLQVALAGGGCAAVVCNTVGAAQQVYQVLKEFFPPEELDLFHARYVFSQREERERRTVLRFGKTRGNSGIGRRPSRFVLVATQVIEQSLDLDFDVMISQVAPADLLLQRMGRLHRHERQRPKSLAEPVLWLLAPSVDPGGVPDFGAADEYVYEPHLLLRTWLQLSAREKVEVPGDVEYLIESVYVDAPCPSDLSLPLQRAWALTRDALESQRADLARIAGVHLVHEPDPDLTLLDSTNEQLEEENPSVAPELQALTRLTDPSVSVVLLPPGDLRALDLHAVPSKEQTLRLLARSASITHRGLASFLLRVGHADPTLCPPGWRRSALLRHHRLLGLDEQGSVALGRWELRDDPELGILVRRKEDRDG